MPAPIPYKILSQTHAEYRPALWQEMDDLYTGGYAIAARAGQYLPQLTGESAPRYAERCKATAYINYFGNIADKFASALFSHELSVQPPSDATNDKTRGVDPAKPDVYAAFTKDADLGLTSFMDIEKAVFRTALLKKRAVLAVDFPSADEIAALNIVNLAGEDAAGVRPYAFEMPLDQIINWKRKSRGAGYEWVVLYRVRQEQPSPFASVSGKTHEWKLWTIVDGFAVWAVYSMPEPDGGKFDPDTPIPFTDGNATTFTSIPLVELELPDGLWVGNKIGCACKEHFQRRSALVAAENKSLVAIPVIKRGPDFPADGSLPSETAQNPSRGSRPVGDFNGRGWVEIGSGDDLLFVEPLGSAYELVDRELRDLKDEIYRVVDQMAASADNSASSMRRSGESKKQDGSSTAIVLAEYGKRVRTHAEKVFGIISAARNEVVLWASHGLDNFDTESRQDILAEALNASNVSIPSDTFKKIYKKRIARTLVPGATPGELDVIGQEIEKGVDAEAKAKADMDAAALKAAQNPPTTGENDLPNRGAPSVTAGGSKPGTSGASKDAP